MNATLIESLRRASGGSLSFTVGLALLGGLLIWLALEIFRALLRTNAERVQSRVALEKLRAQLHETKLRCREAEQAQTWLERHPQIHRRQKSLRVRGRLRVLPEAARRPSAAAVQARTISHVPTRSARTRQAAHPLLLAFRQSASERLLPRHDQKGESAAGQTRFAAGRGFEFFLPTW